MSEMTDRLQEAMLSDFRALDEQRQKEIVMLGCNAKFVLRMIENVDSLSEVGKTVQTIIASLKRGIPSIGGEDL